MVLVTFVFANFRLTVTVDLSQIFISVQSHGVHLDSLTFWFIYAKRRNLYLKCLIIVCLYKINMLKLVLQSVLEAHLYCKAYFAETNFEILIT